MPEASAEEFGVVAGKLHATGLNLISRDWQPAQLQIIDAAVERFSQVLGSARVVHIATGGVRMERTPQGGGLTYGFWILPWWKRIVLGDPEFQQEPAWRGQVAVVHELGHAWDAQTAPVWVRVFNGAGRIVNAMSAFVGAEPGPTCYGGLMGPDCHFARVPREEWAESVAAYVFPEYTEWLRANLPAERDAGLRPKHKAFVEKQIEAVRKMVANDESQRA